jgi:hypothetical protein
MALGWRNDGEVAVKVRSGRKEGAIKRNPCFSALGVNCTCT